mmetsp:Transcript_2794/g.7883  ORF Transcript_2794/g.7883 Transcript_2794/m.7883 type:complete len:261 (-) Transcript_2794:272-1054(-)
MCNLSIAADAAPLTSSFTPRMTPSNVWLLSAIRGIVSNARTPKMVASTRTMSTPGVFVTLMYSESPPSGFCPRMAVANNWPLGLHVTVKARLVKSLRPPSRRDTNHRVLPDPASSSTYSPEGCLTSLPKATFSGPNNVPTLSTLAKRSPWLRISINEGRPTSSWANVKVKSGFLERLSTSVLNAALYSRMFLTSNGPTGINKGMSPVRPNIFPQIAGNELFKKPPAARGKLAATTSRYLSAKLSSLPDGDSICVHMPVTV